MNHSKTQTISKQQHLEHQTPKKQESPQKPHLTLKLQDRPQPRVSWTSDTIDNEHMNKKKSNLCCIYHRPGQSSSDTCTSDDEGNALERDRHTKHMHKKVCSKLGKGKKGKKDQGKKDQAGQKFQEKKQGL